jgi:mercuric ion transport protein
MTIDDATDETTPNTSSPAASPAAPNWLAALGLAAALGAVIASSCCVIPLGLAAVGAGTGVFGRLELLAEWRVEFLSISALAIVGGLGTWWWKRPDACVAGSSCTSSERSRKTLTLLLCASAVVLTAANWGYIDPILIKLVRGH